MPLYVYFKSASQRTCLMKVFDLKVMEKKRELNGKMAQTNFQGFDPKFWTMSLVSFRLDIHKLSPKHPTHL